MCSSAERLCAGSCRLWCVEGVDAACMMCSWYAGISMNGSLDQCPPVHAGLLPRLMRKDFAFPGLHHLQLIVRAVKEHTCLQDSRPLLRGCFGTTPNGLPHVPLTGVAFRIFIGVFGLKVPNVADELGLSGHDGCSLKHGVPGAVFGLVNVICTRIRY